MKRQNISTNKILDAIVPITRFNRGEANKIFDEVSENGVKIVFKNNAPACVLVNPEEYDAMVEALEDFALYIEAERRAAAGGGILPADEVMRGLGITDKELADTVIDIE